MTRSFSPKVVTANDLFDGDVVYLAAGGGWTRRHSEAELFTDEASAEAALAAAMDIRALVGPYLAEARAGEAGPEPVHFREEFRTRGPSNYHHGKQTEGAHV